LLLLKVGLSSFRYKARRFFCLALKREVFYGKIGSFSDLTEN